VSSQFLTSSMYLCHFLTSVDSMNPFASGSRIPLLSTVTQFFQKSDSILILILHLMRDLGWHKVKTPLLPAIVGPHNIQHQHFLMLQWVLLCDYCSYFYHLPKTSKLGRAINACVIADTYFHDHCLLFRVCSFAELSFAFTITAPEGAAVVYTNTSAIFSQGYITRAWGMPTSFVHSCIFSCTLWKVGSYRFLSSPKDCST
jgi:hypothetical protein